jgi:phospholipid/cholesterol/gamma-HCH transport system substrate-binding protein
MSRGKSRTGVVAVVAGVLLLVVGGLVYKTTAGPSDVQVTALFSDAYPMVPGNQVKLAGVQVGEISSITEEHGLAHIVMSLDPDVLPLHTDARATITTQDLLGEKYISLEKGSPSAPVLPAEATLGLTQTNRVVDLQDVLNALDTPTSTTLAALLTTTGEGLRGNGQRTSDAIAALAPALQKTDEMVNILNGQNKQLNHLIDDAQPVASAVASNNGKDLDSLVGSTTQTLNVTAQQQQALSDTLAQLPATFASARRTLYQVAGVAEPTADTLASIRPTTDKLIDISHELYNFSDAADPALESLPSVLDKARKLFDEARPVAADLRRIGPYLRSVGASAHQLNTTALPHLTDALELAKGWTLSTTDYDAVSHYFRAIVTEDPKDLGQIVAGPIPGAPYAPIPQIAEPAPPVPPYDKLSQHIPTQQDGPGDPRTSKPFGSSGGVTGLNSGQEHSMVSQMLGGS